MSSTVKAAPPAVPAATPPATSKPGNQPLERPSASEDLEALFASKSEESKKQEPPSKPSPEKTEKSQEPVEKKQEEKPEAKKEVSADDDEYLVGSQKKDESQETQKKDQDQQKVAKEPEPVPVKAPELRAAYAKAKARVAELQKEVDSLKAKPVEDAERKTFTEQISTLTKQLDEALSNLKFADYERSKEYKDKYETPFVDAWNEGVDQVKSLTITNSEGETRKGDANDFAAIMRESDNERAAQIATEMFGNNAFYVLSARRELQRINNARLKALAEYKSTAEERSKAEAAAAAKANEEAEGERLKRLSMFKKLNEEAATKYPDLFAPLEGDEEGNKILEKGIADADLAFSGGNGLTANQLVRLHSAIRNRSAGFGRLVHRLKAKEAKIAELEKVISDLRESTPGHGEEGRERPTSKELTAFEELDALAKAGQ